ncbi:MAG: hypothetical protein KKF44_04735 [Nanoarchaeota archaeon]|nr:hypothetical protein [Nanoarchaeota archaeon]
MASIVRLESAGKLTGGDVDKLEAELQNGNEELFKIIDNTFAHFVLGLIPPFGIGLKPTYTILMRLYYGLIRKDKDNAYYHKPFLALLSAFPYVGNLLGYPPLLLSYSSNSTIKKCARFLFCDRAFGKPERTLYNQWHKVIMDTITYELGMQRLSKYVKQQFTLSYHAMGDTIRNMYVYVCDNIHGTYHG